MSQSPFRTAYGLSCIIAVLATLASAGGLFLPNLYRDNEFIITAFRGNDAVTLVVVVPLLIVSIILSAMGSSRARLVWLGSVVYMLYNYAFYLFAAAFNPFFLLYVALFTLPIFALIVSLPRLNVSRLCKGFHERTPVRWIAGYMLFFSLFIGGLWLARIISFLITGDIPSDIIQTGHPTGIVYALDLSLMVPWVVFAGLLLWQRKAWGYVLSVIMLVKGAAYPLALVVMSVLGSLAGYSWDAFTWLWVSLSLGGLASCTTLLLNLNSERFHHVGRSGKLTNTH